MDEGQVRTDEVIASWDRRAAGRDFPTDEVAGDLAGILEERPPGWIQRVGFEDCEE